MHELEQVVRVQGTAVPALGFGTWQIEGDDAREAVRDALEIGYRHIDTAKAYGNEREVGAGIRESGVAREEIWLTTKVPHDEAEPNAVRAAAEGSLERLRADYVDLLLLHWPGPARPPPRAPSRAGPARPATGRGSSRWWPPPGGGAPPPPATSASPTSRPGC